MTLLPLAPLFILAGCASVRLNPDPEVTPSADVARAWTPPTSLSGVEGAERLRQLDSVIDNSGLAELKDRKGDLTALIDLALRTSPETRDAWYAAQAANARFGRSRAPDYPTIDAHGEGGYLKLPIQFPGQTLVVRNEAFLPEIRVSYDLLDFGRTRAAERSSREQLVAANFMFNRTIQNVVFEVEKAYYTLGATKASVNAAESNLKLARSSLEAVQARHRAGLATRPQIRQAEQVQAQAVYDLENAKSMVQDAGSALHEAIGMAPDVPLFVQDVAHQGLPPRIDEDVEMLMAKALANRPDVAAKMAGVRASNAGIARAESDFYPEVDASGKYGQVIWSYTINGAHTQNLNQPFYGALLALRWNLFTGFDHYYAVEDATAERNAVRAELKSLELEVVNTVWQAYFDFLSTRKKYDASAALLASSEEAYKSTLESHRHGLSTVNDLIGAERDLMAARYTLVQNQAELLISSCRLVHAVGAKLAAKPSTP